MRIERLDRQAWPRSGPPSEFRYVVLQSLRLVVNFIPEEESTHVMKESFEQTMMAQDLCSPTLPHLRKDNAMVFFVLNKRWSLAGQLLQHPGHGSSTDLQMTGQGITRYSLFFRTAQLEDRLEVVIDGLGRGWKTWFSFH